MHLNRWIAMFVVATLSLSTTYAENWTQFRGPGSRGISNEKNLPVTWGKEKNLRWQAELPGRGLSSPVIAGNKVFVTACSGYMQKKLHVLCFDLGSGKKQWERHFLATGGTACHPKTSMAAPTPVTDGKRVFALFGTCDLACLDLDGNLEWYRSLVGDYPTVSNQVGMAASPVIWKDLLIVHMENAGESFAAGIDAKTGKNRWKVVRNRRINWTTPLVVTDGKEPEVIFLNIKEMAGYDPATGKKRWSYEGDGATAPSPAIGKGVILVPGREMVALRYPVQDKPEVLWKSTRLKPRTGSPVLYQGRVYSISSAGILNCGDPANGKVLWQQRLKGPFSSSPIAADGKIYAVNEEGVTFVVQVGDKAKVLASNPLEDTILATPAISQGAIFLRSDKHLYCVSKKD